MIFAAYRISHMAFALLVTFNFAVAADPPGLKKLDSPLGRKIDESVIKARDWLIKSAPNAADSSEISIVAYALHKAGVPATDPLIANAVTGITKKIQQGSYTTGTGPLHHVYEAACDAMLLVDLDATAHRDKLSVLRDYIIGRQRSNGSWHYPATSPTEDVGDTSITQFAILGLWAVRRAEIEVPNGVWEKAAQWLFATQHKDGGFAYHPNEKSKPDENTPTLSMTAAGASSLLIIQRMLHDNRVITAADPATSSRKRFGVLEFLPSEQPVAKKNADPLKVKYETLERNIKNASSWIASHYTPRPTFHFFTYELYGCERVGSLLESEKFGSHNWYEEGADSLIAHQNPEGNWNGHASPRAMAAFGMLFLVRATQSIVQPRVKVRMTGAGLLAGGRGLPDDLSKVTVQDGSVKQLKKLGPLDEMLADLEKSAVGDVPVNPQSVIATLQFDNPEELVGKLDQLPTMLQHPKPEVRQVAAWALGRSGDLRQIPRLITALADPDINVAADASLALCVLTRQPQGVVKGEFATERIAPEPPEVMEVDFDGEKLPQEKIDAAKAAQAAWRRASQQAWNRWYLNNRPYDERDDRQQIRNK